MPDPLRDTSQKIDNIILNRVDGQNILTIFHRNMIHTHELTPTQLLSLLRKTSELLWNHYNVEPR